LWQEQVQSKPTFKLRRSFAHLLDALLARQGSIAYIPIIIVTFGMFCGVSWMIFWSQSDPARYQCYALTFWFGSNAAHLLPLSQCTFLNITGSEPALHMLPLEYPPFTLLPFSLALLAPLSYYQGVFAMLMALTALLIYWLLLRYGPRGGAAFFALYVLIGAIATSANRFDLLPSALTLLCIMAAERKHWTAAYVTLAFAVLLKLYPLLLLPPLFLAEQRSLGRIPKPETSVGAGLIRPRPGPIRALFGWILPAPQAGSPAPTVASLPQQLWSAARGWRWKNCLTCLGIIVGITSGFALLNFQGAVVSQFSYFLNRPIQIEATGSVFLWIAARLGVPTQVVSSYGSINIVSSLDSPISCACLLLLALGYLYTLWMQWRGKLDVAQAAIALLLLYIVTGKVFSPQYLIWLMPLLAYTGAFDAFWLLSWGTISLLTSYIFIFYYSSFANDPLLVPYAPGFFAASTIRNALLVLLTLAYLFNWFGARQHRSRSYAAYAHTPNNEMLRTRSGMSS
jgi:hypothetical protein